MVDKLKKLSVRYKKLTDKEYYVWVEIGEYSISIPELFVASKEQARRMVWKIKESIKNNHMAVCPEILFGYPDNKPLDSWSLTATLGYYDGHVSVSNFKSHAKALATAKLIQHQLEQHADHKGE